MSDSYRTLKSIDANNLLCVDSFFETAAKNCGAEYFHNPAMIESDVLQRCGYFASFPHHLTIASYINPSHYDKIAYNGDIEKSHVCNSDMYLTPSACLHFYPMVEGETIDQKILTTRARVYRYEEKRFD